MSGSLEKLKALSDKLEKKLQARQKSLFDSDVRQDIETISVSSETPKTVAENSAPESPHRTAEENDNISSSETATKIVEGDNVRQANLDRLETLYRALRIDVKVPDFDTLFSYKAMNLSGVGLKEEDFGEIREGKYIQIISITYEPDKNGKKKAKNISLGYFGKAETIDGALKNDIIEFVLRWRYEKAFQNVDHYKTLLEKLQ